MHNRQSYSPHLLPQQSFTSEPPSHARTSSSTKVFDTKIASISPLNSETTETTFSSIRSSLSQTSITSSQSFSFSTEQYYSFQQRRFPKRSRTQSSRQLHHSFRGLPQQSYLGHRTGQQSSSAASPSCQLRHLQQKHLRPLFGCTKDVATTAFKSKNSSTTFLLPFSSTPP